MGVDSSNIFRFLEPAVRPHAASPTSVLTPQKAGATSFDELLKRAANGAVSSGRQIQVKNDIASSLSVSQLERLAEAADKAEAAGAKRALFLLDGRAFVVDLETRELVKEVTGDSANQLEDVDGAMWVGADNQFTFLEPERLNSIRF